MESVRFSLVGFGIQQSFAVESRILGFQMRNTAQGIRNPTNDARGTYMSYSFDFVSGNNFHAKVKLHSECFF